MKDKLYKEKDLIDEVQTPIEVGENHRREDALEEVLPNIAEIKTCRKGSYNGEISIVIRLKGEIWLYNDYFGSCSGCDYFLSDHNGWTEDMLRNAYCFETKEDAIDYMNNSEDYSWKKLKSCTINNIKELKDTLALAIR